MSNLTLNKTLPDMSKATISLWFRVPSSSLSECRAALKTDFTDVVVMLGTIPFISWGKQLTGFHQIGSAEAPEAGPVKFPPSYLGVSLGPRLEIHLQTPTNGTGDIIGSGPAYFGNSNSDFNLGVTMKDANQPELSADEWHHVLISWDLRADSSSGATSTMYCAIDDKNKAGADLPALNDPKLMGPNQHMSNASFLARNLVDQDTSLRSVSIPSDPISSPAPSSLTYNIHPTGSGQINPLYMVELAELQIFCGVALNASQENVRRAFIDMKRDADGNPVQDADGNEDTSLYPVDPRKAEELVGQRPDVLLHGSSNWKNGTNTGSLGMDEDGNKIPDGQFEPAGKIEAYKPDPKLDEAVVA